MRVLFHPDFPKDVRKFESDYALVSQGLAARFRSEIDEAIESIKLSPNSAGHFLNLGSAVVRELRRRNLRAFPFFILYGVTGDRLIIGAVIASRSDPLTWLSRLKPD
jgi:hypothetical protein